MTPEEIFNAERSKLRAFLGELPDDLPGNVVANLVADFIFVWAESADDAREILRRAWASLLINYTRR